MERFMAEAARRRLDNSGNHPSRLANRNGLAKSNKCLMGRRGTVCRSKPEMKHLIRAGAGNPPLATFVRPFTPDGLIRSFPPQTPYYTELPPLHVSRPELNDPFSRTATKFTDGARKRYLPKRWSRNFSFK